MLDFEKVAFAGVRGAEAVADLSVRVKSRLERMGATKGLRLSEIEGLGQAKEQARIILADLEAYLKGRIPWSEVDRGMLLIGPPGVGKTMLAKAISKEAGVRFIQASAAEWQASSHLGEHIQAIRNSFSLARRFSPSILFIDEFDSIGRRGSDAHNEFYHTAVVNCVLEELQGFEDRDGVMVIAATNRPDAVDPALKRAGRLDRTVEIHYPTIDALEHIYRYYIGEQTKLGFEHGTLNLKELARLSFGQTGADVEVYVRGAARRARMRAGNGGSAIIQQADFVAEIMKSPTGGSGAIRLGEAEMRRTAIHEAGHALIQIVGPTRGANISYLSITPRADGTLGFVFNAPDARYTRTRGELEEMVRVLLGGRAAEAVVFGAGNVSSGAGGPSPAADLAQATTLLRSMAAHYGFSRRGGLVWRGRSEDRLPDDVDKEVRQVLDRLYVETQRRIRRHRGLLNRIVRVLLERQDITGDELRKLLGR
jgi:ATP-dependent Zn protease